MPAAQRDMRRKTRVLEHAARIGTVRKTCRYFGVARSGFHVWKKAYETHGDDGLVNQKPSEAVPVHPTAPHAPRHRRDGPSSPPPVSPRPHPHRWYLERYHGITISKAGVSRLLPAPRPESLTQSRRATSGAHASVRHAGIMSHSKETDPGIILLRGGDFDDQEAKARLTRVFAKVPEDQIRRSIVVVDRYRIRRRELPLLRA